MASLDLGTLKAGVVVEGAEKAKSDLKSVNETIKSTEKSTGNFSKGGLSSLAKALKESTSNVNIFGMKLGDLGGAFTSGASLSSLLQGAVAGLSMAFVNLAVQALQQAIAALWDFSRQAVQTASDLEESANVVNVVFGENNSVSKWAEENASAFNLSRLEAEKFAGTMGAVLTPSGLGIDVIEEMSINLTKLSGDLGSLWNKSSEEAFNALRSAITGETEPMKNFGVVMTQVNLEAYMLTQGINKQWKELTQAEQALVRYNYILENTKTAQGDAMRTADGYANASKQLELAIENVGNAFGQGLLPGLTSFKQHVAGFIQDNQELISFFGNLIGTILNYIIEFGRLVYLSMKPVIDLINMILKGVNEVLKFLNEGLTEVAQGVRSSYKDTSEEVTYEMQDMASATKEAMGDATTSVEKAFDGMEESAKDSLNGISEAYKSFFQKQMSEYEKQLREQYNGGTLREEKKIQEKLALHEKMLNKQLEKDEEYEKRRLEIEKKYRMQSVTENGRTSISYVPRYANGTLSATGGLSVVGEVGRELMYVPPRAQIINNNTTEKILSGAGGPRINISQMTVVANNVQEFVDAIKMATISGEFA